MRIAFMGSPDFAVPCLRALATSHQVVVVVSQPDKPAGRGGQIAAPAVKRIALELGLPIIQPKSARSGELRDALVTAAVDLAVVVAYGKILPNDVLAAPRLGCINVHASLLPRYRGAAPVQWAVINGDRETGVAIMQLDEGMDTGPVWSMRRVAIDPRETSGELLARLAPIGAAALLDALPTITAGTSQPTPQDHALASHAPMLTKADGAIDFARPAEVVAARIRGVDPWPGAFASHRDQPLKLFRARPAPLGAGRPGTIIAIDGDGLVVACSDGAVTIDDVQAPGRKRMAAAQFAAGRGIAVGEVLAVPAVTT